MGRPKRRKRLGGFSLRLGSELAGEGPQVGSVARRQSSAADEQRLDVIEPSRIEQPRIALRAGAAQAAQ
jgi:hypothetical protein